MHVRMYCTYPNTQTTILAGLIYERISDTCIMYMYAYGGDFPGMLGCATMCFHSKSTTRPFAKVCKWKIVKKNKIAKVPPWENISVHDISKFCYLNRWKHRQQEYSLWNTVQWIVNNPPLLQLPSILCTNWLKRLHIVLDNPPNSLNCPNFSKRIMSG